MIGGFGQAFPTIEKGAEFEILVGGALPPLLRLCVANPKGRTLRDCEGKNVGSGSVGALLYDLTVALLRKNGVDVDKVHFINIRASGAVFRGVVAGTVDAGLGDTALIGKASKYKVRAIPGGNMTTRSPGYIVQGV